MAVLGGRLTIDSAPGAGARLKMDIPLAQPAGRIDQCASSSPTTTT
jgi:hypothetical protein